MLHAVVDIADLPQTRSRQEPRKVKASSREHTRLAEVLHNLQALYVASELSQNIERQLRASLGARTTPITTIVSLGLGSLLVANCRSRRMKQLAILLAIQDILQNIYGASVEIYAQDPSFTRMDESFLRSLGILILHTSSTTSLGEAASFLSASTLVYTPFLTLEVYEQLLVAPQVQVPLIFSDDFNALLKKWPKYSSERKQVERVAHTGLTRYKRRTVGGKGFWEDEDGSFPMALYGEIVDQRTGQNVKAMI